MYIIGNIGHYSNYSIAPCGQFDAQYLLSTFTLDL